MTQPDPEPKTVTLAVTKEQLAGIKSRQQALSLATMNQRAAQRDLNSFLSGVVTGHGYDQGVEAKGFDDEKLTLTIVVTDPLAKDDADTETTSSARELKLSHRRPRHPQQDNHADTR